MIKHVIYGVFGLLAASIIALAIYLDKPAPALVEGAAAEVIGEEGVADTQLASAGTSASKEELFELIRVIDGDTIAIQKGGATETIRFIGINAPETGQCYSGEATAKLKSLLASGSVALELDASQGERDKYDRLLAYVFTEGGVNTARALIEGGFAKEYTYNKPYKYQAEFRAAQTAAQTEGRGLWAAGACAPAPVAPAASPTPVPVVAPTPAPTVKKEPTPKKEEPQKVAEEEKIEEIEEEEEDDPPPSTSGYTCSANTYNCTDFQTHAQAQAVFDACGGAANDVHKLDANKDGQACESLP